MGWHERRCPLDLGVEHGSDGGCSTGSHGLDRPPTDEREEYETAHPYPEVEPRRVPAHYRYVDSDAHCRTDVESLHRNVFKCSPSVGLEPQIGDVVTSYVEVTTDDGKVMQDRIAARVVWPQETYVRARLFRKAKPDKHGKLRRPGLVDIPRSAAAGITRLTAAA